MSDKPTTGVTFDAAQLTDAQADGMACVICNADYMRINAPQVPVGVSATGSQVFACESCVRPAEDIMAVIIRIAERIEHRHGPDASRVMLHTLDAALVQDRITEDVAAELLHLVGCGDWPGAQARLDEIGYRWEHGE